MSATAIGQFPHVFAASAPASLYWARFTSGNGDRHLRRGLTQAQLDRIRESVGQHVTWGPEPLTEHEHRSNVVMARDRREPGR